MLEMCLSACLITLLLLFSVQGFNVVARIHFSQDRYVVQEGGPSICVEVINDDYPADQDFAVTFTFSTALMGVNGIDSTRSSSIHFPATSRTAQLCFPHNNDNIPCERDITGTLRLINSTAVRVREPASAHITIRDDDIVLVGFENEMYSITEGVADQNLPVIKSSTIRNAHGVQLLIVQAPTQNQESKVKHSLSFPDTVIPLNELQQHLSLNLQNDNVALEDPEEVTLQLRIGPETSCPGVNIGPINSTTVLILDEDKVTVEFVSAMETVKEGMTHQVCVTISRPIARSLDIRLQVSSETADLSSDLELSSDNLEMTFPSFSDSTNEGSTEKCLEIIINQDSIIEDEEYFTIELMVITSLPPTVIDKLEIGNSLSRIVIEDTSSCSSIVLSPMSSNISLYVHKSQTICFSCDSCIPDLFWNLTSHEGHIWNGMSGDKLTSEDKLPHRGVISENGTLLLTNSSSVFSKNVQSILSFGEVSAQRSNSYEYYIYIGDAAAVIGLNYSMVESVYRFSCIYKGSPRPEQMWLVDSESINYNEMISKFVDSNGEDYYMSDLFFNNTTTNINMLTCTVFNPFGSDASETTLHHSSATMLNYGKLVLAYSLLLFLLLHIIH